MFENFCDPANNPTDTETCMVPGCTNHQHTCGLCKTCLGDAFMAILHGRTNMAELEDYGLATAISDVVPHDACEGTPLWTALMDATAKEDSEGGQTMFKGMPIQYVPFLLMEELVEAQNMNLGNDLDSKREDEIYEVIEERFFPATARSAPPRIAAPPFAIKPWHEGDGPEQKELTLEQLLQPCEIKSIHKECDRLSRLQFNADFSELGSHDQDAIKRQIDARITGDQRVTKPNEIIATNWHDPDHRRGTPMYRLMPHSAIDDILERFASSHPIGTGFRRVGRSSIAPSEWRDMVATLKYGSKYEMCSDGLKDGVDAFHAYSGNPYNLQNLLHWIRTSARVWHNGVCLGS